MEAASEPAPSATWVSPRSGAQASAGARRFGNVLRLTETESTNLLAADAARAGTAEGLVVVADRQRAGRGRRRRRWVAPPGGALLCSVVLRPKLSPDELFAASATVSLAALGAIERLAPADVAIKWPNDLVTPAGKLAGLLAELVALDPPAVVVGLGLNLAFPPGWPGDDAELAELVAGATTLEAASGRRVERDAFLDALLDELEARYAVLRTPGGPAAIRGAWARACRTIGSEVRIETESGTHLGRAVGVDRSGALLVEVDGEQRRFAVGDVEHLRPAGSPPGGPEGR